MTAVTFALGGIALGLAIVLAVWLRAIHREQEARFQRLAWLECELAAIGDQVATLESVEEGGRASLEEVILGRVEHARRCVEVEIAITTGSWDQQLEGSR